MADDEKPCGSEEKQPFLDRYEDVNNFVQQTLRSVLQATKSSNELPAEGDDFDFYSSFSGFQDAMGIEGKRILHMIQSILKHQNVKINLDSGGGGAADIDDKFDLLMDGNDQILERAGQWLDEASGIKKQDDTLIIASATPKNKQFTTASWNKKSPNAGSSATTSFRLLSARNIQRPQMKFKDKIDNSRHPFRPHIKHKYHAKVSLEESLQLPEGVTPEMAEAPTFVHPHLYKYELEHKEYSARYCGTNQTSNPRTNTLYPHPYKYELEHLEYNARQLDTVEPTKPLTLEETPCIYVETEEQLNKMLGDLKTYKEIAVDLEHHSYRTFQGFTCLMQISTRNTDYIVDTLTLRSELHVLNEVFTDPSVVKVLHGAEHDIGWLMRDLGLYVINMFDTGQAGRVMNFSRFSLAHLLQHYCSVTADKQFQLADWRIRPLPEELMKYAREDTHYLLYIYDVMKNELIERGNENKNLLYMVLQKSVEICSKVSDVGPSWSSCLSYQVLASEYAYIISKMVYKKPVYTEDSYKDMFLRKKRMFNSQQIKALQDLYAWRDQTARQEDESYGYVLPNHMLLQICDILPRESQGVLACCNPIPPLVRQYLPEIHGIIMRARDTPLHKVTTPKARKPTQYQHPKYNVDSLLNCPHDLSHIQAEMGEDSHSTLLDSSLIRQQSSVYPELSDNTSDIVVVKEHPLLSVFDNSKYTCLTVGKKKANNIKAEFSTPYLQFMPAVDSVKSEKKRKNSENVENWKLKPKSGKRKERDADSTLPTEPPQKRSRTNLHEGVSSHVRFDDDGDEEKTEETYEKTEDDKKALPQDLEIPFKFQAPAKKKKKKNRNKDADIIDAVQKHLSNIRKIQEENERALGENSGDEQPIEPKEKVKKKKDKKNRKGKDVEQSTTEENGQKNLKEENLDQSGPIVINNSDSDEVQVVMDGSENSSKDNKVEERTKDGGKDNSAAAIVIGSSDEEQATSTKPQFKPYDYSKGAQQLFEDDKNPKSKGNQYYNPNIQMKKQKVSKNKGNMKQGAKSFTFRR